MISISPKIQPNFKALYQSWWSNLPGFLGEQSDKTEDEEHEKHPRVLEIVHVGRVQDTIDKEVEMSGVEELDAQVNEWANGDNVKLQVLDPTVETRDRVPNSNPKWLGVGYEANHRAPNVPDSNHKEQRTWQSMTFERTHLSLERERERKRKQLLDQKFRFYLKQGIKWEEYNTL